MSYSGFSWVFQFTSFDPDRSDRLDTCCAAVLRPRCPLKRTAISAALRRGLRGDPLALLIGFQGLKLLGLRGLRGIFPGSFDGRINADQ